MPRLLGTAFVALALVALGAAPASAGLTPKITAYPTDSALSGPFDISSGPDGALWFTELSAREIGRMTVAGEMTLHSSIPGGSGPYGLSAGSDGAMWFVAQGPSIVGRIDGSGAVQTKALASALANPTDIVSGPDGALWFTESVTRAIGRIPATTPLATPDESRITTGGPGSLVTGSDGNLWFTEYSDRMIGRMTPAGVTTYFPTMPSTGNPAVICAGADGALWYVEDNPQDVVRIASDGTETAHPLPAGLSPFDITTGPDGALWFASFDVIARMTPDGSFQQFPVAAGAGVTALTTGPDGNMWFNESNVGKIGRVTTPPIAVTTAATVSPPTSARITGTANGHAQATSFHIEYGPLGGATTATAGQSLGTTDTSTPVSASLTNLKPVTTYRARVVVTNPTGSATGTFVNFTTPALPRPVLSHVHQSARRWREGKALARIGRVHRPPIGTKFRFSLNEQARVTLMFTRRAHGHRIRAGSLSFAAHAGVNKIRFQGRLSRRRRLKPGSYTVVITARNAAGMRSAPSSLRFTILKR